MSVVVETPARLRGANSLRRSLLKRRYSVGKVASHTDVQDAIRIGAIKTLKGDWLPVAI
jgi:hypothetical protein